MPEDTNRHIRDKDLYLAVKCGCAYTRQRRKPSDKCSALYLMYWVSPQKHKGMGTPGKFHLSFAPVDFRKSFQCNLTFLLPFDLNTKYKELSENPLLYQLQRFGWIIRRCWSWCAWCDGARLQCHCSLFWGPPRGCLSCTSHGNCKKVLHSNFSQSPFF